MNFKIISDVVSTIINTIQNTATAMVVSVKKHTFLVKVTNSVKNVNVKGTVTVGNQMKVESKLKDLKQAVIKLTEVTQGLNKKKYDVEVLNYPTQLQISNLKEVGGEITKTNTGIDKLSKDVQSLHKPLESLKEIEIANQPIEELNAIIKELTRVVSAVKEVKVNPQINVAPSVLPKINIPQPKITVQKESFDYEKLASLLVVPEIDYQLLAKTMSEQMSKLVITGGGSGGGRFSFMDTRGNRGYGLTNLLRQLSVVSEDRWGLNNSYKDSGVTYTGEEDVDGNWIVRKIVKVANEVEMSYATIKNNPDTTNYESAWENKLVLTYNRYSVAFALE